MTLLQAAEDLVFEPAKKIWPDIFVKRIPVYQVDSVYILNEDWEMECQHVETRVEKDEDWDGNKFETYVCEDCEAELEGDPVGDRAEDAASFAYDEERENRL